MESKRYLIEEIREGLWSQEDKTRGRDGTQSSTQMEGGGGGGGCGKCVHPVEEKRGHSEGWRSCSHKVARGGGGGADKRRREKDIIKAEKTLIFRFSPNILGVRKGRKGKITRGHGLQFLRKLRSSRPELIRTRRVKVAAQRGSGF